MSTGHSYDNSHMSHMRDSARAHRSDEEERPIVLRRVVLHLIREGAQVGYLHRRDRLHATAARSPSVRKVGTPEEAGREELLGACDGERIVAALEAALVARRAHPEAQRGRAE